MVIEVAALHLFVFVGTGSVAVEVQHLCFNVVDLKLSIELKLSKVADVARGHLSNLGKRLSDARLTLDFTTTRRKLEMVSTLIEDFLPDDRNKPRTSLIDRIV